MSMQQSVAFMRKTHELTSKSGYEESAFRSRGPDQRIRPDGYDLKLQQKRTADATNRVLQQMETLKSNVEAAAEAAEVYHSACERVRKQLHEGILGLAAERDDLKSKLVATKEGAAKAVARVRQSEHTAALARRTRDDTVKKACKAGAHYAALRAEAMWLRKIMATMPDRQDMSSDSVPMKKIASGARPNSGFVRTSTGRIAKWNTEAEAFQSILEPKDNSYFACKLHKLNDDCFDEPHEPRSWRTRDLWIGRQGVLYYYSKKDDRAEFMFNSVSIGRLHVKRLGSHEAHYPLCISVAFPPSENPEDDPNPTWFGINTNEDLVSILKAYEHFQDLTLQRDEALFAAKLMKSVSASATVLFDKNCWRERDLWIGTDGVMYYYSIMNNEILAFFKGQSIAELKLEVMPQDATCYPFSMKLLTPDGKDQGFFGSDEEEAIANFVRVWERFAS